MSAHVETDDAEGFGGTERFRLQRRLGAGSFGVVYEVYDRAHDAVVALKVLRAPSPDAIARFKQEFRSLADLTHPNLVALHELAFEDGRWFFTMERVEGVTLLDHARGKSVRQSARAFASTELSPLGRSVIAPTTPSDSSPSRDDDHEPREPTLPADPARVRHLVAQLASGLAALHAAGKIHRDVKPSNALVTDAGRVVLLDFGLVTELAGAGAEGGFLGTPAYASPEQVAGKSLGAACDAYAIGVITFEALAGRLPFEGPAWRVVGQKMASDAPDLHAFAPGAPDDLRALCAELLHRDPASRPSAAEVAWRLAPDATEPPIFRSSSRVPFVGRARELDAFGDALDALDHGVGTIATIQGPSGVGKSALARRVIEQAQARGATVLSGRCYEQEHLPYKTLDGVIDSLVARWSRLAPREYADVLPRDAEVLTRAFPALLGLPAVAERMRAGPEGEPHEVRRRAFAAMRDLFGRLARRERVVLFVDDLQWGDRDGALLLGEILRAPSPPLLFVCTYRDEDRATSEPLRAFETSLARHGGAARIDVGLSALSSDDTAKLATSMFPGAARLPREALDAVVAQSAGLPFLVGELVRAASAPGALHPRADAAPDDRATTVERVVRARVEALSEDARALLRVVVLAGQPVPRAFVREAWRLDDEPTALASLRGAGLVRTSATGGLVEAYHDRIRETVRASIAPDDARAIHASLARALEAQPGAHAEPERLAHHHELAGDRAQASVYAERAGDRASGALAFDRAAAQYARAIDLAPGMTRERRASLLERRAGALVDAGRSAEAGEVFVDAAAHASPDAALQLECRSAEHLLRAGLMDRGVASAIAALRKLDVRIPRTLAGRIVWLLVHRAWQVLRGLSYRLRASGECDSRELLRHDACSAVALALSHGDPLLALIAHQRALEIALALGEPTRLHKSIFTEAAYAMVLRGARGTRALRARLVELQPLSDLREASQALPMFDAFALYFEGRWRDAHEALVECERFLTDECRGVAWEIGTVRSYLLATLHFMGDLPALAARIDAHVREAEARGDVFREASLRVMYTFFDALVRDDPAQARDEIAHGLSRWAFSGFTVPYFWASYGEVEIALYEGDAARASSLAERLWREYSRSLSSRITYLRALTVFLRGRAAVARLVETPGDRSLAGFVERCARRIEAAPIPWAKVASRFLRAALARAAGDDAGATRLLEEAASVCDAEGFALYGAIARRARGGEKAADAEAWMRASGVACPAKLARTLGPGLDARAPLTALSPARSTAPRR